jgi:hypothetical protein
MWDVLAIAPTDDPKAIRRAYAARLRQIDPDRDRETFAQLRQALEWALTYARQPARRLPPQPERVDEPEPTNDAQPLVAVEVAQAPQGGHELQLFPAEPPRVPGVSRERTHERALLIDLEAALQRRDARAASRLYVRAAAIGAVPLGDAERMLARLFAVAVDDPKFDGAAFRDLAKDFGWDRPELDSAAVSEVRNRVTARLAAETWYDELVGLAGLKRWGFPRYKSRVARLMLKRIRGWGLLRISRPALRATLDTFRPHEHWLHDRISSEWVATLERRMWRRELIASALQMVFTTFLLLDLAFVMLGSLLGFIKDDSSWVAVLVVITGMALLTWLLRALAKHIIGMWRTRP